MTKICPFMSKIEIDHSEQDAWKIEKQLFMLCQKEKCALWVNGEVYNVSGCSFLKK